MVTEKTFSIEDQRADEDIVFVQRRHPWVLSKAGFIFLGIIILIVLSFLFFGLSFLTNWLIILGIIFILGYAFYIWFLYNNYFYVLTNQRIIIIEQDGLFSRQIVESELDKIQNITVEVKGMMATILNFGDIKIRTAGIDPTIVLESVNDPYEIQQKIVKYCKKLNAGT